MRGTVQLAVLAFGLAGCASANQASIPEVVAATDLIQAGQIAKLAATLGPPSDAIATGSVALTLNEASSGLIGDGAVLRAGVSRPMGAAAHLQLALPSLQALRSDYAAAGPTQAAQAGRAQGYLDAFLAAARSYDADAMAAGLAQATLPVR